MTIRPVGPAPTSPPPAAAPVTPPARNDHDGDDGAGAAKPALEKGVGERLDKTA